MPTLGAALARISRVSRRYQSGAAERWALRDVSLEIAAGEALAIVGPSGSGKSTLMNLLGLLDRPSDGHYWLGGIDTGTLDREARATVRNRSIGFVFQGFRLLARSSALENVELPLMYRAERLSSRERHGRALAALETVGLADRSTALPSELSGGQQQRVAIARALVNRPALLLADEPTGSLDTRTGDEILRLFLALRRHGLTLVVVTHDLSVAERCDRQIALRDGRVVSSSAPRQVLPPPVDLSAARAARMKGSRQ